jgi:hypothetical protein
MRAATAAARHHKGLAVVLRTVDTDAPSWGSAVSIRFLDSVAASLSRTRPQDCFYTWTDTGEPLVPCVHVPDHQMCKPQLQKEAKHEQEKI